MFNLQSHKNGDWNRLKSARQKRILQPLSSNTNRQDLSVTSTLFASLKEDVPSNRISKEADGVLQFCLVMSNSLVITTSVSVQPDFSWYTYVTGNVVPRGNQIIQHLPEKVNTITSLKAVLSTMESARICPGNPEEHFVEMVERKGGSVCATK